ncbi:O-methyltransferase [Pseudonocardia oroxyli]|uniref:O-methyltransferase n=1 Tax=Pseudonocardia oroxyli TaxID=366584 RepID=UPI001FDEFA54|nr:class I SAM-dependent methyltransferase [Pseudonocardia oroxyli]
MGGPRPVTPTTILAALLADAVARHPEDAELRRAHDLAAGLDPYLDEHTSPASAALRELERRTREHVWEGALEQEMLSGHVEGRFLRFLVRMTGARRVLEIGLFTGYSALAMAEALPADGVVVACEVDADVAEFARGCVAGSPAGGRIDVRVGPAEDTLRSLDEPFDLVFLDADKAGYLGYLDAVLESGLLAEGGTICVDNTLMQGLPWTTGSGPNAAAVADFNRAVAADPRVEQVLVPLRDGVTLIRRVS